MATIVLDDTEVTREGLPELCAHCGATPTKYKYAKMRWHPMWAYFFFGYIGVLLTRRSMITHLPFCQKHSGMPLLRQFGMLFLVFAFVILAIVGFTSKDDPVFGGPLILIGGVGAFGTLITLLILASPKCTPVRITKNQITLKGISPIFIEAVEARRATEATTNADRYKARVPM